MQGAALGAGGRPLQILNRFRVEYDDNVRQQDEDADSSLKLIEEVELHLNMNFDQSFVGVRYRPSYIWWADRDEDDTDFHHDLDFILNHTFTPRLSLSVKDTFRLSELPELIESSSIVRENNDFIYNTLNGTLAVRLRPETRLEVAGRHILLRYDEDDVGDRENYDIVVGGLTLRHQLRPATSIGGDLRYEQVGYEEATERDSETAQGGAVFEHTFSQNLLGNIRAGISQKTYEDDEIDDESSPYVNGSLTILPSPATRMTLGGGYSLFESGVFPYAGSTRTRFFANLAHDITARVSCYISGVYTISDYDSEQLPADYRQEGIVVNEETGQAIMPYEDGAEDVYQLSARITYQVNRQNWLEAGWQYSQLDSELERREEFERNRFHVGWKVRL
jgi:hypothetical protein